MSTLRSLLLLILVAVLFTACGGGVVEESDSESASVSQPTAASTAEAAPTTAPPDEPPSSTDPSDETVVDNQQTQEQESGQELEDAATSSAALCTAELKSSLEAGDYSALGPGIDLHGCDLSRLDLSYVDFSGANLALTNMYSARLDGADFSDANLAGAALWEYVPNTLAEASFANADLANAIIGFHDADELTADHPLFTAKNLEEAVVVIPPDAETVLLFTGEPFFFCGDEQPCNSDGTAYATAYKAGDFSDGLCITDVTAGGVEYCHEAGRLHHLMKWNPSGDLLMAGVASEADRAQLSSEWDFSLLIGDRATQTFAEYPLPYYKGNTVNWSRKSVAWSQDGAMLALPHDGVLHIHALPDFAEVQTFPTRVAVPTSIAWNSDGTQIAMTGGQAGGSGGCQTRVWDVATGDLIHTIELGGDVCPDDMAWSPDGTYFVTSAQELGVQFWDPENFEFIGEYSTPPQIADTWGEIPFRWLDFTQDGRFLRVDYAGLDRVIVIPSFAFPPKN
jgi:hypothetical protein